MKSFLSKLSLTQKTKTIVPYISNLKTLNYISHSNFGDKFKEKESAEEAYFVNKNEREALKKILKKAKAQNKNHEISEITDLKAILNKHKVTVFTDELIKDIQKWRDEHH